MSHLSQRSLSILKALADVLLPTVCYICEKSCSAEFGLCEECLAKIRYIPYPYCTKCGRGCSAGDDLCPECRDNATSAVEKAWSCCYYTDTVKDCIHLFKYRGYAGLADIFGYIMLEFAEKNGLFENIDFIVPVPMHSSKKRERSYNHAELLARFIAKRSFVSLDSKNLKKIKWTQSQSELDKAKRLNNVKDTFLVIDKEIFRDKSILLIDDVYTTGATINECAGTLLSSGSKKVFSFTLARGV